MRLLAEKMCPRRSVARAEGKVKGSVFNVFFVHRAKKFQKIERVTPPGRIYIRLHSSGTTERNGRDRAHGKQSSKRKRSARDTRARSVL